MDKATIEELHRLERERKQWASFKDALECAHNIAIKNFSYTPATDIVIISRSKVEEWDNFENYIMSYVNTMVDMYDEQIAEL